MLAISEDCSVFSQQKFDGTVALLEKVSSDADDLYPVLVDSCLLFITSDRNYKKNEKYLQNTQDVYVSQGKESVWDSVEICNPFLNSGNHDAIVGYSPSEQIIFVYKQYNNGDIYSVKVKPNGKYSGMKELSVNTDFHENSATLIDSCLYFTSNRPGGKGLHDVYRSVLSDDKWSSPEIVDLLSSDADENYIWFDETEESLYLCSNRSGGLGGYDIYRSKKSGDSFSPPTLLPEPINSSFDEIGISGSWEDFIFFASTRNDSGKTGFDVYLYTPAPEPVIVEKEIPVILQGTSDVEKEGIVNVEQLRFVVKLSGEEDKFPNEISVNKEFFIDTTSVLRISDLMIPPELKLMDDIDDAIAHVKTIVKIEPEKTPEKFIPVLEDLTLEQVKDAIDFDISYCKIQVGAFSSIVSVSHFEQKFPLLKGLVEMDKFPEYNKFLLKQKYNTLDDAAVIQRKCLTELNSVSDTFIAVYDKTSQRILIYFDVEKNLYKLLKPEIK